MNIHGFSIKFHDFRPWREARDGGGEEDVRPDPRAGDDAQKARVHPSPATHAILAQLKAGETVYQAGELPKTL